MAKMIKFKGIELEEGTFTIERDENEPFLALLDEKGRLIYSEDPETWKKYEYNEKDQLIKVTWSDGDWSTYEYDANGNLVFRIGADGSWGRFEYDDDGNFISCVTSDGDVFRLSGRVVK